MREPKAIDRAERRDNGGVGAAWRVSFYRSGAVVGGLALLLIGIGIVLLSSVADAYR